jgi:hypothetical protein
MRTIFSIVGFALFIVGCNSLVPLKERVIELPTQKYQQQDSDRRQPVQFERLDIHKETAAIRAIRESCRRFGSFRISGDKGVETYSCREVK